MWCAAVSDTGTSMFLKYVNDMKAAVKCKPVFCTTLHRYVNTAAVTAVVL